MPMFQRCIFLVFLWAITNVNPAAAQCPGCITDLPELPADTVYIADPPPGQVGTAYDADISFRLPQTTATVDPTFDPPLNITGISILSVTGLPPGLQYQASQIDFDMPEETDGCVKFCGTPLVADSFYVTVAVEAQLGIFSQETSFNIPFYMAPAETVTDGFGLTGNVGCGSTTAEFTNNVASNDNEGVMYFWDFGNGTTSTLENPPPATYNMPGVYPISYEAVIDTTGYFLSSVTIESSGCSDIIGAPDFYLTVNDPTGEIIYVSETIETEPPVTFTLPSLPLEGGNYGIQVTDDDPFAQVDCGSVNFNFATEGVLIDGELTLSLDILHPVTTVTSESTVTVYAAPPTPEISPAETADLCEGETVALTVEEYENMQWYRDGEVLIGETTAGYTAAISGAYYVIFTSPDGCTETSEPVAVTVLPAPENPFFAFFENELTLVSPEDLPEDYDLQWYFEGEELAGETGFTICMEASGDYALTVTDHATGCTATHDNFQVFFPGEGCAMTAVNDLIVKGISISPNPTRDLLTVNIPELTTGELRIIDVRGQLLKSVRADLSDAYILEVGDLPAGIYILQTAADGKVYRERFVKL